MSEILSQEQHAALVNDLMISAMEDIDLGRNEAGIATLARQSLLVAQFAALRLALATATKERDDWFAAYQRTEALRLEAVRGQVALTAERDATVARLKEATKIGIREAFVDGAKWWEEASTGGTMWQSDQHRAADEAEVRFPAHEWVMWPLVRRLEEALVEKEAEIATLKAATVALPPEVREAAERLLTLLYLYPNYRVDSRGPSGLIVDALEVLAPDLADGLRGGETPEALLALLAARRGDA